MIVFCVVFCRSVIILFLLAIVLPALALGDLKTLLALFLKQKWVRTFNNTSFFFHWHLFFYFISNKNCRLLTINIVSFIFFYYRESKPQFCLHYEKSSPVNIVYPYRVKKIRVQFSIRFNLVWKLVCNFMLLDNNSYVIYIIRNLQTFFSLAFIFLISYLAKIVDY
jgi:hypothetical protein